ncbi:MAG: VWA domain-containing protein, partial [Myxococcota bacterium]
TSASGRFGSDGKPPADDAAREAPARKDAIASKEEAKNAEKLVDNPNLSGASTNENTYLGGSEDKRDAASTTVGDRDEEEEAQVARGPVLDWGATVYLSNDDSMSLASAQRLLYATMHGLPFTTREIRPHELLNYFSFDAVTPDADQVFDVLASAEQDGDALSVALAIKGATPPRAPLDLTVLVDRSCSMMDEGRMDYTKRGLDLMTGSLRKGDRLDVVLFDDGACVPLENYVVGRDDPALLSKTIAAMQPEGSTDVGLGLRTAYEVAKRKVDTHDRNRRVMIVTDALMNTGDVDPNTVSDIGKAYDADGIRLTGVGVGSEFDDTVLDMLTEKGKGAYVFLGSAAVVDRVFGETGFDQLVQTIAHDVQFALKLPASLAMERFYGEEASTVKEEVQPVNYYAGTTQLFLQDLKLKNGKVVASDPVELEITYRDARTGEPEKRLFRTTVGAMVGADPHNVRKGLALMAWTDLLTAEAMGADPCADPLQAYASRASLVQEDAEIAFVNGLVQDRCGAFPLPRVVSNRGVPFKVRVDADIPISTVALSCPSGRSSEALSGSDVIAMFTVAPGVCDLTLSGTVDMTARVEVPATGGDLRCVVRGGRVSCS